MPHIANLYRPEAQVILLFKEVWAMEKLDGTNCFIKFNPADGTIHYASGGAPHESFVALFNEESLLAGFKAMALPADKPITLYAECYGGKMQGMSASYGKSMKFCAFDVKIGENWTNVPVAEKIVRDLGLDFVHYVKIPTDLKELDKQRDEPSVQAIRNGITTIAPDGTLINPRKREGIICRPLEEMKLNNGSRVICKHKNPDFRETKTPRKVELDESKIQKFAEANQIADEYVTETRLQHILDKIPSHCLERMREVLDAMVEDVLREGAGEIVVEGKESSIRKAICSRTAVMYKNYLKSLLTNSQV